MTGRGVAGWAAVALVLLLPACTSDTQPSAGPTPTAPSSTASAPAPESSSAEPSSAEPPGAEATTGPAEHPVALVVHATDARADLRLRGARRVLDGELSALEVVAAPGMPVGPDVPVLESAVEVLRRVERGGALGVLPAGALTPTVRPLRVGGAHPLRDPVAYPITVAGPAPADPVTLTVVGDVMLARGVTDPRNALRPMSGRLRSADITVGNLESTLSTDGEPRQGDDSFGADSGVIRWLRLAGFDAISLANNHSGDYGEQALLTTVRLLRESALRPFGAGADLKDASRPAVVEVDGTRVGFLGFNAIGETPMAAAGVPGAFSVRMPPRTGPLNEGDLRRVLDRVGDLARRVDVVVVLPHWGAQYTHRPEPVQRLVARRLVDAGADLVVGGHPHWVQGLETHSGGVVVHSLGNFVFDMDFMVETQQGVVLEATLWDGELKGIELLPYRMDVSFAPRPAGPEEAAEILADVWSTSTGPFTVP